MTNIEELHYIVELLVKHGLPLSPILEYAIKEREEQYSDEVSRKKMVHDEAQFKEPNKDMDDYVHAFANLKTGTLYGKKLPHKAILLIAIMSLIDEGVITENRIELDRVIAEAFANSWNSFCETKVPTVWTPFFHLKGDPFWHFKANGDEEKLQELLSFGGTPSIGKMRPVIKYAYFDKALFDYLENEGCRKKLREILIKTYIA